MHSSLSFPLFCSIILVGSSVGAAVEPAADAVEVAKAYIGLLKNGEAKRAVTEHWNADALLSDSFGLTYLQLPEAERNRSQAAFADFVAVPFSNERLMQIFRTIEIKDVTPTQIDPSRIAVRIQIVGDAGKFRAANTLLLTRSGEAWKITDQRQGEQFSMRVALAMTYATTAKGPADTLPVVLEKVVADTLKQMVGK